MEWVRCSLAVGMLCQRIMQVGLKREGRLGNNVRGCTVTD